MVVLDGTPIAETVYHVAVEALKHGDKGGCAEGALLVVIQELFDVVRIFEHDVEHVLRQLFLVELLQRSGSHLGSVEDLVDR